MRLDIKRNAKKGMVYGLIHRLAATILPFFVQTVFIRQLGIEYVGVKGLFTSILTVFSLAELGFGNAIVFSMYKPIAEENYEELCALLNLFRKIYRIIGLVILTLALLILPFLPHLVNGSYPQNISIYCIFILFTAQTIISYWLFAYKSSLLYAYQRTDIISIIGLITTIGTSAIQILILLWFHNFYLYLIVAIVFTIISNIITAVAVNRMYPQIKCIGLVDPIIIADIKKNVAGVFIGRVCNVTRNSFDSIFISSFIGLVQAGIYSNYFYVLTAVSGLMMVILSSLLAGVGNRIVLESKDKNYKDMMRLNTVYLIISGWAGSCMLCLYQPFMALWMGIDNLFQNQIMVLFPIYFYIQKMGDIRWVYSEAAGLFWEDRWRCIAEAVANIILNFFLVRYLGGFGILLATIITLFIIGFFGSACIVFNYYFEFGMKSYLLSELKYMLYAIIAGATAFGMCSLISIDALWIKLSVNALICVTIVPAIYWVILSRSDDFKNCKDWIIKLTKQ